MLFATRHYMNQRTYLDKTVPFNPAIHSIFPTNTVLIQPGHYKSYILKPEGMFLCALDCTQPGLYQIFIPANEGPGGSTAYIYYFINASTALGLASAVGTLHAFGTVDSNLTTSTKIGKMRYSPLSMQCGESADILRTLAMQSGYEARFAAMYTHRVPNGYSDGHTIVEIKGRELAQWTAFDSSLNFCAQVPGNEKILSIAETCEAVWAGTVQFQEIAPFQFDAQTSVIGGWNPWGWGLAGALYDDAERAEAVKDLCRIPLVQASDGIFDCYIPASADAASIAPRLTTVGYRVLSQSAFMAKHYP